MKISLFIKAHIVKVFFLLLVLIPIIGIPTQANAGFFSDLVSGILGKSQTAQADQPAAATSANDNVVYNSQTIPLPESSIDPDMKNINNTQDNTAVVEDGTLLSNNGSLGPANDLEKYASSAKINVYIVKEGDTLESIAKKFKISKDTIFYSNADLEDKDTLKIGQTLVILPVKDDMPKPVIKKEDEKTDVSSSEQIQTNTNKPADEVDQLQAPAPAPVPAPAPTVDTTTNVTPAAEPATPTGQPTGTVVGGYIWPFPEGVGRISQGLHADQAYDFAAPKGTPIYAVQSGIVLIAHSTGYNGGYGLYVVINFNDGRQAIFGHMSKVAAKAGDIVKQGDIIGYVGSTGHSTGPHVHIGFHGTLGNPYVGLKINSTDLMIND